MNANGKSGTKALISAVFDRSITLQQPAAKAHVERLRRVNPDKTPQEIIKMLDRTYLGVVTTSGAAAGATAAAPNGVVQIPAALADVAAYLEASVLYALSLAEVHEVHVEDLERRRLLVTAIMLGNSASSKIVDKVIGRTVPHWGKKIVETIPNEALKQINKVMGPRFVTKWGTKQGVLVLGKQVPLMLGAAVGGTGNGAFGWFVIKSGREILGPAPGEWSSKAPSSDLSR